MSQGYPSRPVRVTAASLLAAIHTGGDGRRTGRRLVGALTSRKCFPSYVTGPSPRHSSSMTSSASTIRPTRSRRGTPKASFSSSRYPSAVASAACPPETTSSVATCSATSTGWCSGSTAVVTRSSPGASAASRAITGSGCSIWYGWLR